MLNLLSRSGAEGVNILYLSICSETNFYSGLSFYYSKFRIFLQCFSMHYLLEYTSGSSRRSQLAIHPTNDQDILFQIIILDITLNTLN